MKLLFISLFFILSLFGEDFSLSIQKQNDKFDLPPMNGDMTYLEFDVLSTNIGLKDIGYSLIVPGYIHFKAKNKFNAYSILIIRSITYGAMGYLYLNSIYNTEGNKDEGSFFANYVNMSDEDKLKFGWALNVSIVTWLYDWIHGINALENKQNMIRYKYGWKLNISQSKNSDYPNAQLFYKASF
jgi:hypothetical protein